jgi:hypothetical protein
MLVAHVSMELPRARAWSGGGGAHLLARRPPALPLRADEDDVEHLAGMLRPCLSVSLFNSPDCGASASSRLDTIQPHGTPSGEQLPRPGPSRPGEAPGDQLPRAAQSRPSEMTPRSRLLLSLVFRGYPIDCKTRLN